MPTIIMNDDEIKRFRETYKSFEKEPTNEYMAYFFKFKNASVQIYKSHKAVFQGSNLEMFFDLLNDTSKNPVSVYDNSNTIGADEVGTGDCFGPIVCCACLVNKEDVGTLKEMGINDSKKIDDVDILSLGEYLRTHLNFKVNIVKPEIYNEISSRNNMNEIKAKLHNQNIQKVTDENQYDYVCLDQFCDKENYFKYLGYKGFKNISFETKGESKSIAVAAASIIARYFFLLEWDKMEKEAGFKIPKGAGEECDRLISKIRASGNERIFQKISKLNFKNYTK